MSWYREALFGYDPKAPKPPNWGRWIKFMAVVLFVLAAWYLGILASIYYTIRPVAAAIWTMLRDVAAACGDFIQYVLHTARH